MAIVSGKANACTQVIKSVKYIGLSSGYWSSASRRGGPGSISGWCKL